MKGLPGTTVLLLLLCSTFGITESFGQQHQQVFLDCKKFGSDAIIQPTTLLINHGFFIFQMDNRGNDPFRANYGEAARNVWKSISRPVATVRAHGWSRFLRQEILPSSTQPSRAQWFPNYFGHVLGDGLAFRYILEWYRLRGASHPYLKALLVTGSAQFLNEVVENGSFEGANVDAVADLLLFQPIGIALFSQDGVSRWFRRNLNIVYWPSQPVYSPASKSLENTGYGLSFKFYPSEDFRFGLFYHLRTHYLSGFSYRFDNVKTLSIGVGYTATDLEVVDESALTRTMTAKLAKTVGLYFEKENSLMMSLVASLGDRRRVRLNLYPGFLRIGSIHPGVVLGIEGEHISIGLMVRGFPLGLSVRQGYRTKNR